MIINLVGPPAAGKSTFAARYVLEHPEWTYCSIDEYRIKHNDENKAWHDLISNVHRHPLVLLETSGLNGRLWNLIDEIEDRPVFTIYMWGAHNIIKHRLEFRQKRECPMPHHFDEESSIDFVLDNWVTMPFKVDCDINVTRFGKTPELIYTTLNKEISHFRIRSLTGEKHENR